jgi:hypothetical protein
MADTTLSPVLPLFANTPSSVSFKKLRKRLVRGALEVIDTYGLVDRRAIETGEKPRPKWLVCLSGGKDSYGLLAVLLDLQWQGALPVDLIACNLDQGQPGFPKLILPDWLTKNGVTMASGSVVIVANLTWSPNTTFVPTLAPEESKRAEALDKGMAASGTHEAVMGR